MRVLRIIKGARVSIVPGIKIILVLRLVASQGKYAFRKQNAYLFIDFSIENDLAVIYWRSGK